MKYEVTNQQYVDYLEEALNAGNITVTASTVEGYYEGDDNYSPGTYEFLDLDDADCRIDWNGSNFSIVSGYEDHPVVEVTWFGSWAFAEHYNLRLPTEQEWEKAARGNTGYGYPWGNNIDGSRANYYNSGDPFEGYDVETTPVGMYNGQTIQGFATTDSPSPYGVYDLAGNVWEWTDSWWSDTSSYRVERGGGWNSGTTDLRSWYRGGDNPSSSSYYIGFRCVVP
jgi:formylglycine-generating enzyme required for sulfatase activity